MPGLLLAALGREYDDSDEENDDQSRALAGAALIAEALLELRNIRKALTTSE